MLVERDDQPPAAREIEAMVCWMSDRPLRPGARYAIKHTSRNARAIVDSVEHRVDVNTLRREAADCLALNEIGRVRLRCSTPLMVDPYSRNRTTGSFILIDEGTNGTAGGGMVVCEGAR
jgi:sulfate adenylyltransferase subunit 1 (EFTu-like GTPase family)